MTLTLVLVNVTFETTQIREPSREIKMNTAMVSLLLLSPV